MSRALSRTSGTGRVRALALVVVGAVALGGLPSAATVALDTTVGAPGVGDPYWPLDGNGGIDVRHYDVAVDYDFATGELSGTTTLTMAARTDLASFHLDLLLPVTAVSVDGVPAAFTKPVEHELRVTPATTVARGDVVEVEVSYAGRPGSIVYADELNWLASDREVLAANEPHMAPWWYPANDHPSDKATFDVAVTGPATHQAVSNGLLVARTVEGDRATTRWRTVRPMTTYNALFALGRYDVEQTTHGGLPSYVAVSRDLGASERAAAMRQLRRSDEITAWLARRLGPYPFESTGGLVTGLPAGFALENQTRPTYPGTPDTELLVHELGHQWFGNSVSVRRWRDIWLNEGFAQFLQHYWLETHRGQPAQQWLRKTHRAFASTSGFWRLDIADPGPARVFDNAVYVRGAMAVQALRHRIGDRTFWRLLRAWTDQRRHGTGGIGDFRTLAEKVARQPLDGFFRAWLSAPRAPAVTRRNGLR